MESISDVDIKYDDLLKILSLIDASNIEQFELHIPDLELVIRKISESKRQGPSQEVSAFYSELKEPKKSESNEAPRKKNIEEEPDEAKNLQQQEMEGLQIIKAPMIGTFYRAPSPGAEPFVKTGQKVREDDIVCIIEVMKVMSSVKAGIEGRIVKILGENGALVEYGQPLFLVEPT
jgi:acetyl-CoA carboxylase biotin carboxyl carrier protein